MIPFVNLGAQYAAYQEEIDSAIASVLRSGNPIGGKFIEEFENVFAKDLNIRYALSCASGTSALILSLEALGLERGDEVIVPDYTFVATAEAVVLTGGVPRFADVGEDFLISPSSAEERISDRTVGIIAVDLFGQCAAYEELRKIAQKHGLWILEDAAQSIGAFQGGKAAGSFGAVAATSFYPTKPFGAYGDGGALLTCDEDIFRKAKSFAMHGKNASGLYASIGTNSRLDAIQAAVLLVKRRHFKEELSRRKQNAKIYDTIFSAMPGFQIPRINAGNSSVFAQYAVRSENRDETIEKLFRQGIPTRIYYERPLSAEPCFAKFPETKKDAEKNIIARALSRETFCLPICAFTDAEKIASKIKSALSP